MVQQNYKSRTCPSCGEEYSGVLDYKSNPRAESIPFDKLKPYWNPSFGEKLFFSYSKCLRCQLLFCPQFFSKKQLEDLHNDNMADNTAGVPLDALKKTQKGYLKFLNKYSFPEGDYLELGPDIGLFAEMCLKFNNLKKFWLFEPNTSVWDQLKKSMGEKDYELSADMFSLDQVGEESISVGILIHVLDHLIDPLASLKEIKSKLKPGGILIIVTHDESSLLAKATQNSWPAYAMGHPQLFRPSSMKYLLNSVGFTVKEVSKSINYSNFFCSYRRWNLLFIYQKFYF